MKSEHKWRIENEVNIIYPLKWECLFFCQVVIVRHLVNFVRSPFGFGLCCCYTYQLSIETSSNFSLEQLVPWTECAVWSFKRYWSLYYILTFHWSMNMRMPQRISLYMSFFFFFYICPFASPLMSIRTPLLFLGAKIKVILSSTSLASVPCPLGVGLCQCSLDNHSLLYV